MSTTITTMNGIMEKRCIFDSYQYRHSVSFQNSQVQTRSVDKSNKQYSYMNYDTHAQTLQWANIRTILLSHIECNYILFVTTITKVVYLAS